MGTIPVPSNWELQGFGAYNYGHDGTSRSTSGRPVHNDEGHYRYRFDVPAVWRGKAVDIVFDGSMTDTEVWVNGQIAGPIHQGAFYRFRYDISDKLRYGGEKLLEVRVAKHSANASVNEAERTADFWIFGGIFRPVWLEAKLTQHLERVALDARHNGSFRADVFLDGLREAGRVVLLLRGRSAGAGG